MSRARRDRKRERLVAESERLCGLRRGDPWPTWCQFGSPQQCIAQERYDRRIYGHPTGIDCCPRWHPRAAALWRHPARLWMGEGPRGYGPEYRRRYRARQGRR